MITRLTKVPIGQIEATIPNSTAKTPVAIKVVEERRDAAIMASPVRIR
jgi:hypothetical protein